MANEKREKKPKSKTRRIIEWILTGIFFVIFAIAGIAQIDGLINLLAAKLAYELSNCSVEEAKKKFQIEDDMTEEEKAEYDKYPLD